MSGKILTYTGSLYIKKRNPNWNPEMEEFDDGQASEFIFEKIPRRKLCEEVEEGSTDCPYCGYLNPAINGTRRFCQCQDT